MPEAKDTDLSYAAGIVDGEGSISIIHHSDNRRPNTMNYELVVRVSNTNFTLMAWLLETFGGHTTYRKVQSSKLSRRPIFEWRLTHNFALEFLILIRPFLKLKKDQADAAIRFQTYKHMRGNTKLTEYDLAVREVEILLMHQLNKSGGAKLISKEVSHS